jgi:hypothetical protein
MVCFVGLHCTIYEVARKEILKGGNKYEELREE